MLQVLDGFILWWCSGIWLLFWVSIGVQIYDLWFKLQFECGSSCNKIRRFGFTLQLCVAWFEVLVSQKKKKFSIEEMGFKGSGFRKRKVVCFTEVGIQIQETRRQILREELSNDLVMYKGWIFVCTYQMCFVTLLRKFQNSLAYVCFNENGRKRKEKKIKFLFFFIICFNENEWNWRENN